MDIGENFFGRVTQWLKKSENARRSKFNVEFESLYPSLVAVAQGAVASQDTKLYLKPYDGFGAIFVDTLLLPNHINLFDDQELNKNLFLHKALCGGILRTVNQASVADYGSLVQRCLQIELLKGKIINLATEIFPEFAEWSHEILAWHQRALEEVALPEHDQAWLRIAAKLKLQESEPTSDKLKILEASVPSTLKRELEKFPSLALAPWCEPMQPSTTLEAVNAGAAKRDRNAQDQETEVEGKAPSEIEVVDLEKEKKKENPVTHSFEKLETADEYKGGYRTADGSDQMKEQKNAVDDLDMKHVTRGGEASSSSYKTDIAELIKTKGSKFAQAEKRAHLYYPEWDFQDRKLLPKHCRLYINHVAPPINSIGENWKAKILQEHETGLEEWKHRLAMMVNQRKWQDRQWEGSEISIDSFVRYWSDARITGEGDSRIYIKNFAALRDFSCLILIDQSYSTDSWVANRRVLDVELESLALIAELLAPLSEPVAIAGTWSETRNQCHFNLYKDFDQPWSAFIDHVPGIKPNGYTRLGPAIRHSAELLSKQSGKNKLLILLTDGKPTDYDRYEGRYGIEDIHHAGLEAAQKGVSVRALTIEKEAKNYFPMMFGPKDYQILKDPAELPERLFKIYFESIKR